MFFVLILVVMEVDCMDLALDIQACDWVLILVVMEVDCIRLVCRGRPQRPS